MSIQTSSFTSMASASEAIAPAEKAAEPANPLVGQELAQTLTFDQVLNSVRNMPSKSLQELAGQTVGLVPAILPLKPKILPTNDDKGGNVVYDNHSQFFKRYYFVGTVR